MRVGNVVLGCAICAFALPATARNVEQCHFVYSEKIAREIVLPALRRATGTAFRRVIKPDGIIVHDDKPLVSVLFTPVPYVEGTWPYQVDINPCTKRVISVHER